MLQFQKQVDIKFLHDWVMKHGVTFLIHNPLEVTPHHQGTRCFIQSTQRGKWCWRYSL